MAAEDYYGDTDEAPAAPTATAEGEAQESEPTNTATINADICPGMQPGDEMVVKIEKVMDGEYLVSYAPEPEEEEQPAEEAPPSGPEATTSGSMAAMLGG